MQTRRKLSRHLFAVMEKALDEGADTRMLEEVRKVVEQRPAACVDEEQERMYDTLHVKLEQCLWELLENEMAQIGMELENGDVRLGSGARIAVVQRYLQRNLPVDERLSGRSVKLSDEAKRVLGIVD